MMKKSIILIMLCVMFASFASCGKGANGITTEPTATTEEPSAVTDAPSYFIKDESTVMENGMYSYTGENRDAFILSADKCPSDQTVDFKFSFDSTSGRVYVYMDVRLNDDGSINKAHMLQIDALGGRLSLYELDGGEKVLMGYAKYKFKKNVDYTVSLRNNIASISVHIGTDTAEDAPVINVSCQRPSSSYLGIGFNGNKSFHISEPTIYKTTAPAENARYKNPLLPNDIIADPSVYKKDGVYYLFTTGSFAYRSSTDLVNWALGKDIADRSKLYGHSYFGGPCIYEKDGIYYMFYTSHEEATPKMTTIFYATSDNMLGPYVQNGTIEEHIVARRNSAGTFIFNDPVSGKDIFYHYRVDPNGVGNVVYGAYIEFKDGKVTVLTEPVKLAQATEDWEMKNENGASAKVCERPNVIYRNGYYYVFYAGSHYKTSYSEGYVVSKSPLTGFEKPKASNPVLDATSSITGVGCTWIVESPDGTELYVMYHSHDNVDSYRKRRLCMDRLTFRKNPDGGPDIPVIHGPTSTYQPAPSK